MKVLPAPVTGPDDEPEAELELEPLLPQAARAKTIATEASAATSERSLVTSDLLLRFQEERPSKAVGSTLPALCAEGVIQW
jgi:hypothetical protein